MHYAIVKDGQIKNFGTIARLFPNSSFPADGPNDQFIEENNLVLAHQDLSFDSSTHKLEYCDPYLLDGVVYYVKSVKLSKTEATDVKNSIAEFEGMQGAN